jgi:Immunity protein Imm1
MTLVFFDLEEEANPLNGMKIYKSAELLKIFDSLRERPPFFFELVGAQGNKLLVGLAGTIGCVQHSHSSGRIPYLMARQPESNPNGHIEFLIGGTGTPVPRRFCMPYDVVVQVATHFLLTGERSSTVSWEEI